METTVLLVDDHPLFRKGLRLLLEEEGDLRVVGEAGDGERAIELVRELLPDVVVMDISLPDVDGIEATRRILSAYPDTKVVALSIHGEKRFVEDMVRAGAVGYVLKEIAGEELVEGLRAVSRGEVYLSPAIRDILATHYIDHLAGDSAAGARTEAAKAGTEATLITKLHRPQISSRTVLRPRLMEQLEEGRQRPLTLVSTPPGYGKSTLVGQWLETCDCPSAWLSLDENDNDLRVFLTYFVAAVQTQFPEALQQTSALLKAPSLAPLRVMANTLINELESVPRRFILVLDDWHRIDEPSIHELLSELLRYPLPTLHLVLVTRTDPMLDLLQLRAYGQMSEVRAQALSFTADETAAFLQNAWGKPVEEAIATALTAKTEGWVTGLQLAALSLGDDMHPENLVITLPGEGQSMDYLVAEALARQPQDVQAWLLKTSILGRFCAPLCEAVCAPPDGGEASGLSSDEFIEWLTERNLFVVPLDYHRQWFRYHHLFKELLQSQLENGLDAPDIADLHARASAWFADNGLIEEAIRHALTSGDVLAAAHIVERNRFAVLQADEWYTLARWLDMLPHEIRQERPNLLLAQAQMLLQSTRVGEILPILERLQSLVGGDPHEPTVLAEINSFRGIMAYFQDDGVHSEAFLSKAVALLPSSASSVLVGQFEYWLGLALHLNGRKETAIRRLNDGIRNRDARDSMTISRLVFGLCFIHMLAGEWNQAFQEGLRLKKICSRENGLSFTESWANYVLGYASLQIYDLEPARHYFSLVLEDRYILNHRAAVDAMAGLALTLQFMGEADEADEVMRLAREFAEWTPDPGNFEIVRSCQARLALLRGDLESAGRWQRSLREASRMPVMLFFFENPGITQCRVLVTMGTDANLEEAAQKLQQLRTINDATHNICQVVEIVILHAMVISRQGRVDDALRVLEQAVAMAMPGGLLRPFVEADQAMAELLARLKKQGLAGGVANQSGTLSYIDQILSNFPTPASPPRPGHRPALIDPLTDRELKVLRLLATELDTQEIAAQLDVQVVTLHTHNKNIYSKLDAHSRYEAVHRARELGLI